LLHHAKFLFLSRYWKTNPTANQDEKLIPTEGGMYETPLRMMGVEMYFAHELGLRRCQSQKGNGRNAPMTIA
jgi:hypothetical protein